MGIAVSACGTERTRGRNEGAVCVCVRARACAREGEAVCEKVGGQYVDVRVHARPKHA